MESKHYVVVLDIDAAPETMKHFREALDELCENGPEYAEFDVYHNGKLVPYGKE